MGFFPSNKQLLCICQCMGWLEGLRTCWGMSARTLEYIYWWWTSREGFWSMEEFPALTMEELASMFSMGFRVHTLGDEVKDSSTHLLYRPRPGMKCIVDVYLEGDQHFRAIWNKHKYIRCGIRWLWPWLLNHHRATCQCASHYYHKGGPYKLRLRLHNLLCRLSILVALEHH